SVAQPDAGAPSGVVPRLHFAALNFAVDLDALAGEVGVGVVVTINARGRAGGVGRKFFGQVGGEAPDIKGGAGGEVVLGQRPGEGVGDRSQPGVVKNRVGDAAAIGAGLEQSGERAAGWEIS